MTRIYIPRDSSARAVGADELAEAVAVAARQRGFRIVCRDGGIENGDGGADHDDAGEQGNDRVSAANADAIDDTRIEIVRNGSRGLSWLEPLLEVETPDGRVGYGRAQAAHVEALFESGFLLGGALHSCAGRVTGATGAGAALCADIVDVGLVDQLPYLARQQRLTFARIGITDPLSLDDYIAHEGLVGLRAALALPPSDACTLLIDSGLRGRGGAAFPTGIKWRTVLAAPGDQKYIVCNADEGDSGSFSDRLSMESDPFGLIEGMTIAGVVTGATSGHIYVRSEYPDAIATLRLAIDRARAAGWLGADVLGSGRAFDLTVAVGAGAYVCGEETALLESLEGKRGIVRAKPPLPALAGLFGKPTVINNVVTLATVPVIFARGADYYKNFGSGRSRGTLPIQLAGNVRQGGLVELAFGVTLRELLDEYAGGTASGRPARAIQVGGPLGAYLPASRWDIPLDYEAYAAIGAVVGHGGIVVHDDTVNMAGLARYAMHFCAIESCGKCTPCRIGSTRGVEVIEKIARGDAPARNERLLRDLCDTMVAGSLCAMGGMTPFPVLSALDHFPEDFGLRAAQPDTVN